MNRQLKTLLLVSVATIAFIAIAQAQSGRRQPIREPAAPVPTPAPDPTPSPKSEAKSEMGFLVGIDGADGFSYIPLTFYSSVVNSCADRLRHGSTWHVDRTDRLTRSDAIKKAKAEKTTYVVYLRFTSMATGAPTGGDVEIEYIVYTPTTGKIATNGRSYPNSNRKGPVVVQPPRGSSNTVYQEQMLRWAAEDAADRILKALHIVSGSVYSAAE